MGLAINNISIHLIFITIFCVLFISDYYNPVELINDPKFSLLDPFNTTQITTSDKYNKLIDLNAFEFKINPQPCKNLKAGLLLIIIVTSNPLHVENRALIRNSWGKSVDTTKTVFLLGETENETLSKKIQEESDIYGDIVQGNFIDSYRNLTYKNVMGLKWVAHHCPKAKYVLKTDDDVVVNTRELRRFLARELSPWGARKLIACSVVQPGPVPRQSGYKWTVTKEEYELDFYPKYCLGWAIIYSADVVSKLLEASPSVPYFWVDDIYISGILAEKINVNQTSISKYILTKIKANLLVKTGPAYVGPFLFGPPNLRINEIGKYWRAIPA